MCVSVCVSAGAIALSLAIDSVSRHSLGLYGACMCQYMRKWWWFSFSSMLALLFRSILARTLYTIIICGMVCWIPGANENNNNNNNNEKRTKAQSRIERTHILTESNIESKEAKNNGLQNKYNNKLWLCWTCRFSANTNLQQFSYGWDMQGCQTLANRTNSITWGPLSVTSDPIALIRSIPRF